MQIEILTLKSNKRLDVIMIESSLSGFTTIYNTWQEIIVLQID